MSDKDFRLLPSMQTAITHKAFTDAPLRIRKAAARDQLAYGDKEASPVAKDLEKTSRVTQTSKVAQTVESIVKSVNAIKPQIPAGHQSPAFRALKKLKIPGGFFGCQSIAPHL